MKTTVAVLVSGGMDSVAALYDAHQQHIVAVALSFDYGSKHNHKEIPLAAWHCRKLRIPHRVISLDFVGQFFKSDLLKSGSAIPDGHYEEQSMKQTVVPFRNGIMLSIAGGYAESIGANGLVIAAHAGDHAIYPDCREDFMKSMADALRLGTSPPWRSCAHSSTGQRLRLPSVATTSVSIFQKPGRATRGRTSTAAPVALSRTSRSLHARRHP